MKARSTKNKDFDLPTAHFVLIGLRRSGEVVYVSALSESYIDLFKLRYKIRDHFEHLQFEILTITGY